MLRLPVTLKYLRLSWRCSASLPLFSPGLGLREPSQGLDSLEASFATPGALDGDAGKHRILWTTEETRKR